MATAGAPEPAGGPAAPSPSPSGPLAAAGPNPRRRLSEELDLILREFDVETVTLREVVGVLHGRGYVLLVLLLCLPFCTPIPLPGLSTPLGLMIALIGLRLALGQKPWLPARLLDQPLPPATFRKVFAATRRLVLGLEKLLRPRLPWLCATPRREQLHALPLVICAALLLLPLPVPFSNTIPAWAIIFLCGGLLERDGIFILAGYATALGALAFFAMIAVLGVEAVDIMWRWLTQAAGS
jgi:hypothetical protein